MIVPYVFSSVLALLFVVGLYLFLQKRRKKRHFLEALASEVLAANTDFAKSTNFERYFNYKKSHKWLTHYQALSDTINFPYKHLGLEKGFVAQINQFKDCFENLVDKRGAYNAAFVPKEKEKFATIFAKVEDFPLDEQQKDAIVHDEDNTLIIAGAGTGKTSTIVGKVAYLLEKEIAQPKELLLVSFTKKSADEMAARIKERLNVNVKVKTFNALGYEVIGAVEEAKPDLAFEGDENAVKLFLENQLNVLFQDENFSNDILYYFAYKLIPEKEDTSFKTLDDYYKYVKAFNLLTFNKEKVKSLEELKIANFLCLNGVKYEYEQIFQPEQKDARYKKYRPDFFLTDYNITLEHFGINRDGSVPPFFTGRNGMSATETYQQGIKWKRSIHEALNVPLLESYSYENREGVLLEKLTEKLKAAGVVFNPIPKEKVLKTLRKDGKIPDFINLVYTFLNLVKSNHVTIAELKEKIVGDEGDRANKFLKIFEQLYNSYEEKLRKEQWVDFNDMLINAGGYLTQSKYLSPYSYIMVDEFQDMSIGRFKFLKSFLDQNPNQKLFCVGDDWQSIYRFTGSDISITTQFEEYFGFTYKGRIETTYRFNDKILDFTSTYIQKNPNQLRKKLKAKSVYEKGIPFDIIELENIDKDKQIHRYAAVKNILTSIENEAPEVEQKPEVLLIGRYNFNRPKYLQQLERDFPAFKISFLTAHKAKGMTVDYAIVVDVVAGRYGFPTEIADDPLLSLVLHEGDSFDNSEERRLFYVALTRAKHRNFLITHQLNRSKFIEEMKNDLFDATENSEKRCGICKGAVVQRTGKFGNFWACTNYPLCDFTEKIKPTVKTTNQFN